MRDVEPGAVAPDVGTNVSGNAGVRAPASARKRVLIFVHEVAPRHRPESTDHQERTKRPHREMIQALISIESCPVVLVCFKILRFMAGVPRRMSSTLAVHVNRRIRLSASSSKKRSVVIARRDSKAPCAWRMARWQRRRST